MSESLDELLELSRKVEGAAVERHPDVEQARLLLLERIREAVAGTVSADVARLAEEHGWAASFNRQMDLFDHVLAMPGVAESAIGRAEMQRTAPSLDDVLGVLASRPELRAKAAQGFVDLRLVPVGLSLASFRAPLGNALRHYHDAGALRCADGVRLKADPKEPFWMWDGFDDADAGGRMVYHPERFDPTDHGGVTKEQMLAGSRFPGWQVLLLENLRTIPRRGQGRTAGGRPQIEAGLPPRQYLDVLRAPSYAHERGLTPQAWLALCLTRLVETGGEVLDDYRTGSACYLTGAYFPTSGTVPGACWYPVRCQAGLDAHNPNAGYPSGGMRSSVRAL